MSADPMDPSLSGRFPAARERRVAAPSTVSAFDKQRLGQFKHLPMELLHQILLDAHVSSLANLQLTNKSMNALVEVLAERRDILKYIPDLMRILQATNADSIVTCRGVYEAMCNPSCCDCGQGGIYLYLLTCRRLCTNCLTTNPWYRALRPEQAAEQFGLYPETVQSLPTLRVPRYSAEGNTYRKGARNNPHANTTGWKLLDRQDARRRGVMGYGSQEALDAVLKARYQSLQVGITRKENVIRYKRWLATPGVESAYSASVLFPWYDRETGITTGILSSCIDDDLLPSMFTRFFTEIAFQIYVGILNKTYSGSHLK